MYWDKQEKLNSLDNYSSFFAEREREDEIVGLLLRIQEEAKQELRKKYNEHLLDKGVFLKVENEVFDGGGGMLYHNLDHTLDVLKAVQQFMDVVDSVYRKMMAKNFYDTIDKEQIFVTVLYHDFVQKFRFEGKDLKKTREFLLQDNEVESAEIVTKKLWNMIEKNNIQLLCDKDLFDNITKNTVYVTIPEVSLDKKSLNIMPKYFKPRDGNILLAAVSFADLCQSGRDNFVRYIQSVSKLFFEKKVGIWQYMMGFVNEKILNISDFYDGASAKYCDCKGNPKLYLNCIFDQILEFLSFQKAFVENQQNRFEFFLENSLEFDRICKKNLNCVEELKNSIRNLYENFEINKVKTEEFVEFLKNCKQQIESNSDHGLNKKILKTMFGVFSFPYCEIE